MVASILILDIICEILYLLDGIPDRRKSLSACARVCSAWSYPAQRLLYHHLTLRDKRAFRSFQEGTNVNTEKGRLLGKVVKMVEIGGEGVELEIVLRRCPSLVELRIEDTLILPPLKPYPSLRVLQLQNVTQPDLNHYLELFPHLQFATLVSDQLNVQLQLHSPDLELHSFGELSLDWPLEVNEDGSPTALRLWEIPLREEYDLILSVMGPTLRSLTMPKSRTWAAQAQGCLQYCPQLQQLCLLESELKGRWYREYLVEFAYYLEDWLTWARKEDCISEGSDGAHHENGPPFQTVVCYGPESHADEFITRNSRRIIRDPRKQAAALMSERKDCDEFTSYGSVFCIQRKSTDLGCR